MGTSVDVDIAKINNRVVWGYIHSAATMLALVIVVGIIGALFVRFGGARIFMIALETTIVVSLAISLFSELIVTTVFAGVMPDKAKYPEFIKAAEELACDLRMRVPRLYILHMGVPNAAAFGLGFFGQYAVGITPELYALLTPVRLKGVLAHEFAHIRSRDLMLMMMVSIVTGFARKLAGMLLNGKTLLGSGPFAYLFGYIVRGFAELVKVLQGILSQEREFQADALGAKYLGTVDPLAEALIQLADSRPKKDDVSEEKATILDGLVISHPQMEHRLEALDDLRLPNTQPQPTA